MSNEPRCDSCRFWVRVDDDDLSGEDRDSLLVMADDADRVIVGECRRLPPQVAVGPSSPVCVRVDASGWPLTNEWEWCGEWQAKVRQ